MKPEFIPCFLCGVSISVRYSKTSRPYFICDPCGLQAFVRREKGIRALNGIIEELNGPGSKIKRRAKDCFELLSLVSQYREIQMQLTGIEKEKGWDGFIAGEEELISTELKLKNELEIIRGRLSKIK